jgi:enoyl-CoA hydratase/carnithine racemase
MINLIRDSLKTSDRLVFTGEGRSFCAGGDIILLATGKQRPSDFFSNEFRLFYEISQLANEKLAILDGITMGGGVGLGMAIGTQVLTSKTLWAMPETAIGFFPDVGSSYYLNRLASPELGLYLALTGSRLAGPDCYFAGVSNIFIESLNHSKLNSIFQSGLQAAQDLSSTPDSQKSQILQSLPLINQCFDCNLPIEGILQKLSTVNNEWSRNLINSLLDMCPVSLKIAKELNRLGRGLNYFEALELEFNLCVKVCEEDNYNFAGSILHKLVEKKKGKFAWRPESLSEVSDLKVLNLFEDLRFRLYGPKV